MAVFKSFPGLKFQKVKFKYFKHLIWTLLNDLRNGPALISWKDFQPRLYWTDNDLCNFLYYCNSIWLCCLLLFSNIARVFSKRHLIIKILEIMIWYVPYFQLHEVFMHKWTVIFPHLHVNPNFCLSQNTKGDILLEVPAALLHIVKVSKALYSRSSEGKQKHKSPSCFKIGQ